MLLERRAAAWSDQPRWSARTKHRFLFGGWSRPGARSQATACRCRKLACGQRGEAASAIRSGGSMTAKLSKELRRAIVDALLRDRVVVLAGLFDPQILKRTTKKLNPKKPKQRKSRRRI